MKRSIGHKKTENLYCMTWSFYVYRSTGEVLRKKIDIERYSRFERESTANVSHMERFYNEEYFTVVQSHQTVEYDVSMLNIAFYISFIFW